MERPKDAVADRPHRDDSPFRSSRLYAVLAAALALILVLALGEMALRVMTAEQDNDRRMEALSHAAVVRAKVERELASLLYLSSGLGSYLVVRNDTAQKQEINDILAVLHRGSRHIRNFGVAVGYRLTYVYPLSGNEQAVGMYYPDHPDQWPTISRIVADRKPALAGPVKLVQGGQGIVYRVPLFIGNNYWGLLSTVIDADGFFQAIVEELNDKRFTFALRGKDGRGLAGDSIWGDMALFDQPGAVIQEFDVPGGSWAVAVATRTAEAPRNTRLLVYLLSGTLGGFIAWMLYALIRSRTALAHRAMYDELTGLPNRILLEDRALTAFARQQRKPGNLSALLFIDLDGFKEINDELGHKTGDAVLRAIAERAKATVRSNDTVARWGGDEFIVLIEDATKEVLATLMVRLRKALELPIEIDGRKVAVGVSMGMALNRQAGGNLDDMLKVADQRMYKDKLSRRQSRP